jgi:hypothetical protein
MFMVAVSSALLLSNYISKYRKEGEDETDDGPTIGDETGSLIDEKGKWIIKDQRYQREQPHTVGFLSARYFNLTIRDTIILGTIHMLSFDQWVKKERNSSETGR